MTSPHDDLGGSGGPGGDDARLGRLLADGLGRSVGRPVDAEDLLAGARRGAVRIRRRRNTAVGLATALVLVVPGSLVIGQFLGSTSVITAESGAAGGSAPAGEPATGAGAADARPVPEAGGPGDATHASPEAPMVADPPETDTFARIGESSSALSTSSAPSTSQGASRTTGGQVAVPDGALLGPADLPQGTLRRTADSGNRAPVAVATAPERCGGALGEVPLSAGSREVVFEERTGAVASRWLLGSTVRVFAGDRAEQFVSAVARLDCVSSVTVLLGDEALAGQGRPDSQGRSHWYGVVRVGRVVSEVRLIVPSGESVSQNEATRLLRVAAERVTTSGLAASAASDPGLA